MFAKRKLARDDDNSYEAYGRVPAAKQPKLESLTIDDSDVAMNDVQYLVNAVPFPAFAYDSPSSASSDSPSYSLSSLPSSESLSSSYPEFQLYPEVQVGMDVDCTPRGHHHHDDQLGLLQPASGVFQHGGQCTQIPRLRLSSHPGLNGNRTLWSHCQSCGAIEMVKS